MEPTVTQAEVVRLVPEPKAQRFDKKATLKKLAVKLKLGLLKKKKKKKQQPRDLVSQLKKEHRLKNVKVFFPKSVLKRRVNSLKGFISMKQREVKAVNQLFALRKYARRAAVTRYIKNKTLTRAQGVYVWAVMQALNPKESLLDNYGTTLVRKKMKLIAKQARWKKRQTTLFAKVVKYNPGYYELSKNRYFYMKRGRKGWTLRFVGLKRRKQLIAWKLLVNKKVRHWRYKKLHSKLRYKVVQNMYFKKQRSFGRRFKRKALKVFRNIYARGKPYKSLFAIRDFALRDKVRLQRLRSKKEKLQLLVLRATKLSKDAKRSTKRFDFTDLTRRYGKIVKKLKVAEGPLPWWKKKKLQSDNKMSKALAIFNKAFPSAKVGGSKWKSRHLISVKPKRFFGKTAVYLKKNKAGHKRRLRIVRWFKAKTLHYNFFQPTAQWRGLRLKVALQQSFKRLHVDKKLRKKTRKQGYNFANKRGSLTRAPVYGALHKVALRNSVSKVVSAKGLMQRNNTGLTPIATNPTFFSLRKAMHACDFNKFFKVNKITARAINTISNDVYWHYLQNLQAADTSNTQIVVGKNKQNVHAARVLRKYIKLLRTYFNEVYESKLAKQVPASSAMYWIREYLRLTSGIKRRVSLWNRFNRVAFNFRPKAKEDEKRGRKKKILFKAKILFDRLFKWLYAQPNARYALASPIQNGVVRDYIIRNQFIFKKQFKMKLLTKVVLEVGISRKLNLSMFGNYRVYNITMLLNAAKLIGAGLATISIAGTGVGIGIIFSALISAYSRTPEHQKQLFTYAILGFALSEAIALFGLMLSFLILFS